MPDLNPLPPKTPASGLPILPLIAVIAGFLVILAGGAFAGYNYWFANTNSKENKNQGIINTNATSTTNVNGAVNNNVNAVANTNASALVNVNTSTDLVSKIAGSDVTWKLKSTSVDASFSITKTKPANDQTEFPAYYEIGKVKEGKYAGGTLYLLMAEYDGLSLYPAYLRFVVHNDQKILLTKISDKFTVNDGVPDILFLDPNKFTTDSTTTFQGLIVPDRLTGTNARQIFVRDIYARGFFHNQSYSKLVFTSPLVGDVMTKITETSQPDYQDAAQLQNKNGFYVQLADGTLAVYKYQPDFIGDDSIPSITWTDGQKNTALYSMTDIGGCGNANYISVMSPLVVDIDRDLVKVGTSARGDTIYGFKDSENLFLKRYYDTVYEKPYNGEKVSYAEFVAARPIIFFVDPWDRLIKLQSIKYGPQAECGKPVIYLYPEKTTKVRVELKPVGGFSKSEPTYGNGWDVEATPTGQLINLADGLKYPYLFWEGRGGIYQTPERGFVVVKEEVSSFLNEKLSQQGLNAKEIADFKEFWVPRMQTAPWYFVTFSGRQTMDQLAPLNITPKPDTVIRILMDFKELGGPIPVKPLMLTAPERKGFTVVEWGGVLR